MRKRRPERRYSPGRLSGTRSCSVTTIGPRGRSSAPSIHGEWKTSTPRGRCVSTISPPRRVGLVAQRRRAASACSGRCRAGPDAGRQSKATLTARSAADHALGVGVGVPAASRARGRRRPSPRGARAPRARRRRARRGRRAATSRPVTPSSTTSARPPTRVATTGVPAFIASASTVPNGSWRDGSTSTSSAPISPAAPSTQP